ncbi:hypothetical protein C8Q75DRAFT_68036 [Abortiporus biennis]|nr:hypothetical protein C8Q75DRAFT_68036 [Abortiporus biennis]
MIFCFLFSRRVQRLRCGLRPVSSTLQQPGAIPSSTASRRVAKRSMLKFKVKINFPHTQVTSRCTGHCNQPSFQACLVKARKKKRMVFLRKIQEKIHSAVSNENYALFLCNPMGIH